MTNREIISKLNEAIENIFKIVFTYDFESCRYLVISHEELDNLYNYKWKMQDILDKNDFSNKDKIIGIIDSANKEANMTWNDCNRRLKSLIKNDEDKLPITIKRVKTY